MKSITRISLIEIARKFGWKVEERPVHWQEVEDGKFEEVAACGTAAVITPVKSIVRGEKTISFVKKGNQSEIGAVFKQLSDEYRGIQNGEVLDTFDWMWPKEGL